MIGRGIAALLPLTLCGCTWIIGDPAESFHPYAMNISDGVQYEADRKLCLQVAKAYSTPLDVQSIASAGVQGAIANAGGAAINPVTAAVGAADGATGEVLKGMGLSTEDELRVMALCMQTLGGRDHAYDIIDPRL